MTEQELFLGALQQSTDAERKAWLDEKCRGDEPLRARIEALLQAHQEEPEFLAGPAFEEPTLHMTPVTEGPGTVVGPYRLLQRIGEGGFGIVYMAEQTEPVRRKVALKIIKPGMDTKEVIARFESERQALALMDHPNIARVLDAGATDSGRPYFVMELVKGVPITEFCDKNHLSIGQRLELFVPVCLAVQHAHHKGIIHRDLKPSNVMVTLHDGRPVPKVIDFGVAKATSQQLTQKTLFTAYGQMIGTPVYMSPEQAEMSGLDIDTRSDIYSLGVLLYELLTGTTPLEQKRLREAGLLEMQRLIREVDAPPPSTRLSTLNEEASIISSNRSTDARRLSELLRGDVDWIVMKALEKDRQRRYATPAAFAEDIERFLKHEAIHARPPSTTYRLRKFIQRNRAMAAGVAGVTATLLVGVVVSTGLAIHASKQRDRARDAEKASLRSLADAQAERKKAELERRRAEGERDRAVKAEQVAAKAVTSEAAQRADAEQQRDDAQRLRDEAVTLNAQLRAASEEQRRAIYAAEMNLVRIEAQRGNLPRMREILMAQLPIHGEEDLRGFEWNYWYRFLNQAQVRMRVEDFRYGQANSVLTVVPGGELIAVTKGTTTEVKEVASGRVVQAFPIPLRILVNRTPFAATGRSVHGASNALATYWFDTSMRPNRGSECRVQGPGEEQRTLAYPTDSFSHVSYLGISRDGRLVAVLGSPWDFQRDNPTCRLLVWNVDTDEIVQNKVLPRALNRLEFSPDGSRLALYLCHGPQRLTDEFRPVVAVVDVASGEELAVAEHNDEIDNLFWLPDQKRILMLSLSYSGPNRKELLTWTVGKERPYRLTQETMPDYGKGAVSPDGTLVAVTGHTVPSIRLIDTELGTVVRTLHNEATTVDSLTFSRDGSRLIAATTTGEVLSWDLTSSGDLFALRGKPLTQVNTNGYMLSNDQDVLAVALVDGSVRVRAADGTERLLREPIPGAVRGTSKLLFSNNGRYLAHQSNLGPDGKRAADWTLLELYDVREGRRLWHNERHAPLRWHEDWAFAPDQEHIVLCEYSRASLIDCQTGKSTGIAGPPTSVLFHSQSLVRSTSGALLRSGVSRFVFDGGHTHVLQDVVTGKVVYESRAGLIGGERNQQRFSRLLVSPDGVHAALTFRDEPRVEVWNLQREQRVLEARGTLAVFSPDGSRIAVMSEETVTQVGQVGTPTQLRGLSVWDVRQGLRLSELAIEGTRTDEIRFSPDGQRLLTLHGKVPLGSGGAVAQGRLWDVASGREILAIPVADVNHHVWDLVFDASGSRLTSLLLGKSYGTGGGGQAVVYDSAPLAPEDDAQLIAGRLVEVLARETPLPTEIVQQIEARPKLKPLVRQAALEQARRLPTRAERIAEFCMTVIGRPDLSQSEYERALAWTQVLLTLEPDSLRSRALRSAVQLRLGQSRAALDGLPAADNSKPPPAIDEWEMLARCIRILARKALGDDPAEEAQAFMNWRFETPAGQRAILKLPSSLVQEASKGVRGFFRPRTAPPTERISKLSSREIDTLFQQFDLNRDGRLAEDECPAENWRDWKPFDDNSDSRISRDEFDFMITLERQLTGLSARSFSDQLNVFEEGLRLVPNSALARNARAWLRATCPDDELRDGAQAVQDATKACDLTGWKNHVYLDTLAAALAETKDFEGAVRWQEHALSLGAPAEYEDRLRAYREKRPWRLPARQGTSSTVLRAVARPHKHPLFSAEQLASARRVPGWACAWSPDGKKLVRNLNFLAIAESDLAILDLETGENTRLCKGGVDPVWAATPREQIYFVRGPDNEARRPENESVWQVDVDGMNLRKFTDGGFPSLTNDGRLFARAFNPQGRMILKALPLERSAESPETTLVGLPPMLYPPVSPTGKQIAFPLHGQVWILNAQSLETEITVDMPTRGWAYAAWSPDGRYLTYGSPYTDGPGVWILDTTTGRNRLLADFRGTLPRWSPDGTRIAIDDRHKNELVILDLTALQLAMGLPEEPPGTDETAVTTETNAKEQTPPKDVP